MKGLSTVAFIDDLTQNTELFSQILKELCGVAEVKTFNSGTEFLRNLQSGQFALVLLDLEMPGMSGYQVYNETRLIDPDVPIIALSGNWTHRNAAITHGFVEFVDKPIKDVRGFCDLIKIHLCN